MQLQDEDSALIRETVRARLGQATRVYVVRVQAYDAHCGGDVGLYVECDQPLGSRALTSVRLAAHLQQALGDCQVDLLLADPLTPLEPVHEAARRNGIPL